MAIYNPKFSLRHAMIEKKILNRMPKSYHDDLSPRDIKHTKNIDLNQLAGIIDRYGRKGSKKYSEQKIKQFNLYSQTKKKIQKKKNTKKKHSRSRKSSNRKRISIHK